jgi:hypothetical protein
MTRRRFLVENSEKDFFISYNSADVDWGVWIAERLENAGYTTIIQAWDFLAGQDFVIGMQQATTLAKKTIAVLSEHYFKAQFTQPEWAAAFVQDPTGEQRKLIPVRVRPCQPVGMFASRIYIDLVDKEEDVATQLLLSGVSPDPRPRKGPASFPGKSTSGKSNSAGTPVVSTGSSLSPKPAVFPKNLPPINKTLDVFIAYSPRDEKYLKEIEKQLVILHKQGLIKTWNSSKILAGSVIEDEIEAHWKQAQIVLLLMSANLIADSYEVVERALAREKEGTARTIPILVSPCLLDLPPELAVLPLNREPITSWSSRENAYFEVARGIGEAAKQLLYAHEKTA